MENKCTKVAEAYFTSDSKIYNIVSQLLKIQTIKKTTTLKFRFKKRYNFVSLNSSNGLMRNMNTLNNFTILLYRQTDYWAFKSNISS